MDSDDGETPEEATVDEGATPAGDGRADGDAPAGLGGVREHWDDILADMGVTAEEYRERGWETLELHPGQVRADPGAGGFDVLLPDDEYETLVEFLDGGDVDDYDVFRAEVATVFFLLVLRDEERKRAVLLPGYYDVPDGEALAGAVDDRLVVSAHRLRRDGDVAFALESPDPFFPDGLQG
jgi:hypothetical protein